MTSNWATATVLTGDPTYTDAVESWALFGNFTIVGPADTFYVSGSPGWVFSGSWSLTYNGNHGALSGIASIAVTFAAAGSSPDSASVSDNVNGGNSWNWTVNAAGTYTQNFATGPTGTINLGSTGQWPVTNAAITYETQPPAL